MRIKGTSNPKCELCTFAVINDKKISCKLTNKKTENSPLSTRLNTTALRDPLDLVDAEFIG